MNVEMRFCCCFVSLLLSSESINVDTNAPVIDTHLSNGCVTVKPRLEQDETLSAQVRFPNLATGTCQLGSTFAIGQANCERAAIRSHCETWVGSILELAAIA